VVFKWSRNDAFERSDVISTALFFHRLRYSRLTGVSSFLAGFSTSGALRNQSLKRCHSESQRLCMLGAFGDACSRLHAQNKRSEFQASHAYPIIRLPREFRRLAGAASIEGALSSCSLTAISHLL